MLVSLLARASSEVANTLRNVARHHAKPEDEAGRELVFEILLPAQARVAKKRTLTSLSQPEETMTGFWGLGENRTHETHSVWPLSVMVNLQSPRVFHSLMVRSREPETI